MTARARRGTRGRHASWTPVLAAPLAPGVAPRGAAPARGGALLLVVASGLLLLLAAAQGYVSFRAQYAFVDHAKRAHLPSVLEALGLDTGAVIFALLALSLARRGRRGTVERILNVACAVGSLTMNLLAADLSSPRSVTVWVLPSALYALASDRLIAVVRRWVLATDHAAPTADDGSAWRAVGGLALWLLRLVFDLPGTVRGLRHWVLVTAPLVPGVPASAVLVTGQVLPLPGDAGARSPFVTNKKLPGAPLPPDCDGLAAGETKRAAMIRLYEQYGQAGDPRYGERARAAAVAGEIAALIGYHPGTARRELARYLDGQVQAAAGDDAEAVA
jgi:hypothetical protein